MFIAHPQSRGEYINYLFGTGLSRLGRIMNKHEMIEANRANWNERVPVHLESTSDFYDIESFKKGRLTLSSIERELVGNVRNKKLLHLMCHFGLDSLSWARLGANVTGIDFSQKAIGEANRLSSETGLNAKFICSDVLAPPEDMEKDFDIVVATYGILGWLPSVNELMKVVGNHLKRDGIFVLVDGHPFIDMYENSGNELKLKYSYFETDEPDVCESKTSYTGRQDMCFKNDITYQWSHDLGTTIRAVINSELELISLTEYPCAIG